MSQLTEHNRYRFDQACRVKAIKTAAQLGMKERLSINFLPNVVYRPEVCIRTTLEAARAHGFPIDHIIFEVTEGERVEDGRWLATILREYKRYGFLTAIEDFGAGCAGLTLLADFRHAQNDWVERATARPVTTAMSPACHLPEGHKPLPLPYLLRLCN